MNKFMDIKTNIYIYNIYICTFGIIWMHIQYLHIIIYPCVCKIAHLCICHAFFALLLIKDPKRVSSLQKVVWSCVATMYPNGWQRKFYPERDRDGWTEVSNIKLLALFETLSR